MTKRTMELQSSSEQTAISHDLGSVVVKVHPPYASPRVNPVPYPLPRRENKENNNSNRHASRSTPRKATPPRSPGRMMDYDSWLANRGRGDHDLNDSHPALNTDRGGYHHNHQQHNSQPPPPHHGPSGVDMYATKNAMDMYATNDGGMHPYRPTMMQVMSPNLYQLEIAFRSTWTSSGPLVPCFDARYSTHHWIHCLGSPRPYRGRDKSRF